MIESLYLGSTQLHETAGFSIVSFKIGKPAPRAAVGTVPSGHGVYDSTRYYGPRVYEVVGEVWGTSETDFWAQYDRLIAALALSPNGLTLMRFRRAGRGFYEQAWVRVDSELDANLENPAPFTRFGVSLISPDPRIYSAVAKSGQYDPTLDAGTGLGFPLTFPLEFGESTPFAVVNEGNFATPVTFTITGPATDATISNETTGESIVTTADLSASQTLVIDTSDRTAKLNGQTNRPDFIDASQTTWLELAPGTNVLRLTGSGFSAGSTTLSVLFRDARIG